jgi:hypothetical protein
MAAIWAAAIRHPGVEAGVSCAGTALECRTAKVGSRAFLHLRSADARFRLEASLREASRPGSGCRVGTGGWCLVVLGAKAPPMRVMTRWIAESYGLLAATRSPAKRPKRRAR